MNVRKTLAVAVALVAGGVLLAGCTVQGPSDSAANSTSDTSITATPTPTPAPSSQPGNTTQQIDSDLSKVNQDVKQLDQMNKDINDSLNDTPVDLNVNY